ncbi:terminase small subunit [Roseomonas frigidaquae]|uniref:Terminase small subunit n=1 Tax=Falsiroseomonas frigidaquae TaxID=487318 RepID=A0ABX1ERY1_9PROT|nr:terminase small subunit [Falsiroseomonas frigidaquae]NKE43394.1 terminase small subunit [Falsiroseomonas frigidaquae]
MSDTARTPAETEDLRKRALALAGYGVPVAAIAGALGIAEADLVAEFGQQIQAERAKTTALVGQSLVQRALKGEGREAIAAAQAWLRETRVAPSLAGIAPDAASVAGGGEAAPVLASRPIVNLDQMAEVLGCSLPTMRSIIRRYDDFPVISRGTNGQAWQIDAMAGVAFMKKKRAEEEAGKAQFSEMLGQIALPFAGGDQDGSSQSLKDIERLYGIAEASDALRVQRGELCKAGQVKACLLEMVDLARARFPALPAKWERKFNLPAPVIREMQADMREVMRGMHAAASSRFAALADEFDADTHEAA